MALPPVSSPATLWRDLRAFLRAREKHEWVFAALAVVIPAILMLMFYTQSTPVKYRPPTVIYVKDWNKGRTEAEIKRQQAIDAPGERAARKAEAEFEAKKRQQFKDIEKALGL
jgi:hypothetical protein